MPTPEKDGLHSTSVTSLYYWCIQDNPKRCSPSGHWSSSPPPTNPCTLKEAEAFLWYLKRTVSYKRKLLHVRKPGNPLIFSNVNENTITTCIVQFSDFGFPLSSADLKMILNAFLTKEGFIGNSVKVFSWNQEYLYTSKNKEKCATNSKEQIFNKKIFATLKEETPEILGKVLVISGDASLPNLGINEDDTHLLLEEVSIVFHCAAVINFKKPLE
ncbi:hypothetical protein AVEN_119161-1 [Araneus ventricosus]|uniref:Thioester reductase (TE) domain-containing protein n=1 Tax=Araneus ventricosus TaxID=182803 RepID=A0A4Y2RXC8_ARAVE|nr:hypothetical protein AVEN_119161-1 [Araneus ventricosus]